jgi:hypothetical protein
MDCFELLLFSVEANSRIQRTWWTWMSPAQKRLGGPAACSISGNYDDKYFKLKPEHEITLQERKKMVQNK